MRVAYLLDGNPGHAGVEVGLISLLLGERGWVGG